MSSPQTNSGTFDSSLLLRFDSMLNSPKNYSLNNGSQHSSPRPDISSDVTDLENSILTWNSNEDFCNFCSKIGLIFNSWAETGNFLNLVRAQQLLPLVNLDDSTACLEFFKALSFTSNG